MFVFVWNLSCVKTHVDDIDVDDVDVDDVGDVRDAKMSEILRRGIDKSILAAVLVGKPFCRRWWGKTHVLGLRAIFLPSVCARLLQVSLVQYAHPKQCGGYEIDVRPTGNSS